MLYEPLTRFIHIRDFSNVHSPVVLIYNSNNINFIMLLLTTLENFEILPGYIKNL